MSLSDLTKALDRNTKAVNAHSLNLSANSSALAGVEDELIINKGELRKNTEQLAKNYEQSAKVAELLEQLIVLLSPPPGPPNPVGPLTARPTGEDGTMLIYELDLPQLPDVPGASDATHGEVTLSFDGVDQPTIQTTIGQAVVSDVRINQGVLVAGSFTFVDDAGNKSADPTELTEFTASDTIPPPDPVGGFGARLVSEE